MTYTETTIETGANVYYPVGTKMFSIMDGSTTYATLTGAAVRMMIDGISRIVQMANEGVALPPVTEATTPEMIFSMIGITKTEE